MSEQQSGSKNLKTFVPISPRSAPGASNSWLARQRQQYFSSVLSSALTVATLYLFYLLVAPLVDWALIKAVWSAADRRECYAASPDGACWAGVIQWFNNIIYGRYPDPLQWRINLVFICLVVWASPIFIARFPHKVVVFLSLWLAFPFLASYLLLGGEHTIVAQLLFAVAVAIFVIIAGALLWLVITKCLPQDRESLTRLKLPLLLMSIAVLIAQGFLTLEPVETTRWGGLFLTLVIASVAIMMALPLGVLLALGRRSPLPVIKYLSISFIELVRSVPLITVLFMAVTMLPFFMPNSVELDKLAQVLVAISLFAGAYMAENVRGGLQAIAIGQTEAAQSLGMNYWQSMIFIVLPQALRMMIPNIVTSFISTLKDTTLVSIIGLFDILLMAKNMAIDKKWTDLHTEPLVLIASIFFILCYGMSQYSLHLEKKLQWSQS